MPPPRPIADRQAQVRLDLGALVGIARGSAMAIRHENGLECGTCQLVCDATGNHGLDWRNPQGGYGIVFRFG